MWDIKNVFALVIKDEGKEKNYIKKLLQSDTLNKIVYG